MRRLVVGVVVLCGCASAGPAAPPATVVAANATVTATVDGDTIEVRIDGRRETVRLIGIDTPETRDPWRPVMCFGPEATAFVAATVPVGTAVRLERDIEARDAYDRLLAYVYRASDGLFVNLELARQGYAEALRIAPNTAHAASIRAAVADARAARQGLWGECDSFGQPVASPP
jgi:micrococcal nuclease